MKVGTDSPMATVTKCTSLSSLDLIEPLGKSDELDAMYFGDTGENCSQTPCYDDANDEDSGSEEFCLQLPVTECIFHSNSVPYQENSVQESTIQNQVVTKHSDTTINQKIVLSNIKTGGYVHAQLLNYSEL